MWWALYYARRRAKAQGVPFSLARSDLLPLPRVCPVLALRLEYGRKQVAEAKEASPSLEEGYVPGNVRVISYRANRIKNNGTLEERQAIVAYLTRMRSGRRKMGR